MNPLNLKRKKNNSLKSIYNLSLDEVLMNYNVEGNIYLCDVDRWLGKHLSYDQKFNIRTKLQEIRDAKNK